MPRLAEHRDVAGLPDEAWLDRVRSTLEEPVQDGLAYPRFPAPEVQRQFTGSDQSHTLQEAFNFYAFVREEMRDRAYRSCRGSRYLDFGCGWGRITRFFLKDFERGDVAGADIDPEMIEFCRNADLPGLYLRIRNGEALPFASGSFRLVTAYSVFTHLPPELFRAWARELLRILAPGGLLVLTVEPPRFLDFIESLGSGAARLGWEQALARYGEQMPALRANLRSRGVVYLPTGGGDHREPEVYGDTVVTPAYVAAVVRPLGRVRRVVDDQFRFWQGVVVVQKTRRGG